MRNLQSKLWHTSQQSRQQQRADLQKRDEKQTDAACQQVRHHRRVRWGGRTAPAGQSAPPAESARRSRCSHTRIRATERSGRSVTFQPGARSCMATDTRAARNRAPRRERKSQFTRALRLFRGRMRTFFEAGFALNIIFSLVKGLMP